MDEKQFAYVIQTTASEENTKLSNLIKIAKVVTKSLKKTIRNNDLNIYQFISPKKLVNANNLSKISKDNEEDLIKFCKEYEGSAFFLFFYRSKFLWHANFRDMSAKFDFTAYGTFSKFKPGVWMGYSGGEYDSGIVHDPLTGDVASFDEYNLNNKEAKKRKISWIKNYLTIQEKDIKKFL